jgi:hypothetical protein
VVAGLVRAFRPGGAASYAVDNLYEWVRHEIRIEPASPVDCAGDAGPVIVDRLTGQVRPAQIFVAVKLSSEASDVS